MSEELVIEVDKNDNKIGLRPKEDFHKYKYHPSFFPIPYSLIPNP
jgi:hypothetical protein